ncbi:putative DNA-binding protein [Blastococcus colisei]|uniref:Putative DNA-binding protein n=1 Tax=Blastococcus colisei TaxID=1564162 RepID=A0A543PJ97_9ACTN|nr:ATP-binding protein [Blastococcus colisei]TQN44145.1 putative DNA-binding protein [Blastococcus colisei]
MSYYLGPHRTRWTPDTWRHVVDAAVAGTLDETQWVELKAALPAHSKPANLELARDLASLAVDGGLLIIGIEDDKGRAGAVSGVELADLADRVDQVARDRVHPPLVVRPVPIVDPTRPGRGCLLVTVDASPEAPHMVDERYWGRGATGKRPLIDADVRRLLALNAQQREDFMQVVRQYVDAGPLAIPGSLHVLLTPRAGQHGALRDFLEEPFQLQQLVNEVCATDRTGWNLEALSQSRLTLRGLDISNVPLGDAVASSDFSQLHGKAVSLRDDGRVALTVTTLVFTETETGSTKRWLSTKAVVALPRQTLRLAARLADYAGYGGQWDAAVVVTGLQGVKAHGDGHRFWAMGTAYPENEYLWSTTTTTGELVDRPDDVLTRLLTPLLRVLGDQRQLDVQLGAT